MDLPAVLKALQSSRTADHALRVLRNYNNPLHEKELHQLHAFRATQQEQMEAGLHIDDEPDEIASISGRPIRALHPLLVVIQAILGTAKLPYVRMKTQKALQHEILPLVWAHTPLCPAECFTVLQACAAQSASLATCPKSHRLCVQALLRMCGNVLFAAHGVAQSTLTSVQTMLLGTYKTRARAPHATHTLYVDASASDVLSRVSSGGNSQDATAAAAVQTGNEKDTSMSNNDTDNNMYNEDNNMNDGNDVSMADGGDAHCMTQKEVEERQRRRALQRCRRRAAHARTQQPRHISAGDAAVLARLKPYTATEANVLFLRVLCDVVRAYALIHARCRRHSVPQAPAFVSSRSTSSVCEEVMATMGAMMYDEDDESNGYENLWRSRDGLRLRRWAAPYLAPLLMREDDEKDDDAPSAAQETMSSKEGTTTMAARNSRRAVHAALSELSALDRLTLSALCSENNRCGDGGGRKTTEQSDMCDVSNSVLAMTKDQIGAVVKSSPEMVHCILGSGKGGMAAVGSISESVDRSSTASSSSSSSSSSSGAIGAVSASSASPAGASTLHTAGRLGGAYVRTPLPNTLRLRGPDIAASLRFCLYNMTLTSTTRSEFQAYCDILLAAAPACAVRRYFAHAGRDAAVQLLIPFVHHAKVLTLSLARVVGLQYGRLMVRMMQCGDDGAARARDGPAAENVADATAKPDGADAVGALLRGLTDAATLVLSQRCQAATEKASVLRLMGDMYAALGRFAGRRLDGTYGPTDTDTDSSIHTQEAVADFLQLFVMSSRSAGSSEACSANATSVAGLLAVLQREVCTPVAQSAGQALRLVSTLGAHRALSDGLARAVALARKDAGMRRAVLVHLDPQALSAEWAAELAMELFDKCTEVEVSRPDAFLALGVALEHKLWQPPPPGTSTAAAAAAAPNAVAGQRHARRPVPSGAAAAAPPPALSMGKLASLLGGAEVLGQLHHSDPDEWMRAGRVAMGLVESVGQCGPMAMLMTHPRGALRAMLLRYVRHPRSRSDATVMVGLWDSVTRVVVGLNQPQAPRTLHETAYAVPSASSAAYVRGGNAMSGQHAPPSAAIRVIARALLSRHIHRITPSATLAEILLCCGHDVMQSSPDAEGHFYDALSVAPQRLCGRRRRRRWNRRSRLPRYRSSSGEEGKWEEESGGNGRAAAAVRAAARAARHGRVNMTTPTHTNNINTKSHDEAKLSKSRGTTHVHQTNNYSNGRQLGVIGGGLLVETGLVDAIFCPREGRGECATVVESSFLLSMHGRAMTQALIEAMESGAAHVGMAACRAISLLLFLLQRHASSSSSSSSHDASGLVGGIAATTCSATTSWDSSSSRAKEEEEKKKNHHRHRRSSSKDATRASVHHTPAGSVFLALHDAMNRSAVYFATLDQRDRAIAVAGTRAAEQEMRCYENTVLREQQLMKTFPARPPKGVSVEDYADMQRVAATALQNGRATVQAAVQVRAAALAPTLRRHRLPFLATRMVGVNLCDMCGEGSDGRGVGTGAVDCGGASDGVQHAIPLLFPCVQNILNATYPHTEEEENAADCTACSGHGSVHSHSCRHDGRDDASSRPSAYAPAPRVLADLAVDAMVGLLHSTPLWFLAEVMATTTGRLSGGGAAYRIAHGAGPPLPAASALSPEEGGGLPLWCRGGGAIGAVRQLTRGDVSQIASVAHALRQGVTHMLPAPLFVVLVTFAQAAFRSAHGHSAATTAARSRRRTALVPACGSSHDSSPMSAHLVVHHQHQHHSSSSSSSNNNNNHVNMSSNHNVVRGGASIGVATQHQLLGLLLQNMGQPHLPFAAEALELLSHVLQHFPALYKSVQQGFVQLMPLLPLARLDVVESCFFSGVGTVREVAATAYAKFAHFARSRRALLLAEMFAHDEEAVAGGTPPDGANTDGVSGSGPAAAAAAAMSNVARLTGLIVHDSRYAWSLQPGDWGDAVYFLATYGHDAERVHRVVATMRTLCARADTSTEQQMAWLGDVLAIGGLTAVIAVAGLSPTLHPPVAVRVVSFLCEVLESGTTSETLMRCVLESGRVVLADTALSTLRGMAAELQGRLAKPPRDATAAQKEQYLATSAVWLTIVSCRLRETGLLEAMIEQHSRILNNSQSEMVHRCVCASMVELTRGNRRAMDTEATASGVAAGGSAHVREDAVVPFVKLDEFVEKCAKQIFHSGSYVKKKAHAWGLVGVLHGLGLRSLRRYGVVRRIQKSVKEKSAERSGAMVLMEVMCEVMGRTVEPYVLALSETVLDGVADADAKISDCADDAARVLMTQLTAVGLRQLIPHLVSILSAEQAKKRVAPLNFIGNVAFCSPKQLAATLPHIMKHITACLFDIHNAVAVAASNALRRVAGVVSCPEIQEHVELILSAMRSPSTETEGALDALLYTRFTNVVDPASLALIIPVLARGLGGQQQPRTRPKAAQIVAAMVSLVAEVKTLEPYAAELERLLEDAAQDPQAEARTTAARALGALAAAMRGVLIDRVANWAFAILQRVQAGSIEKMGAAQVFVELVHTCGPDVLQAYFPVVAAGMTDERPPVREGFLCILVYAPSTFRPEVFQGFLPLAFPWVLEGLSHFSDKVREVALTAGDGIIALYGTRHLSLVLTPLLRGVRSEVSTMRHSSLLLSAKLMLHLVSLIRKRMRIQAATAAAAAAAATSASVPPDEGGGGGGGGGSGALDAEAPDAAAADGNEDHGGGGGGGGGPAGASPVLLLESARSAEKRGISVLGALAEMLGEEALVQLLAAIYCGRHEHHASVRADCNMAWQACVASIRTAVNTMFDALMGLLIHFAASDNTDCVEVAGKTMEYTTSMNEMVERVVEGLCARYHDDGSSRVKLGVLVGLQHMVPLTDAKRLMGMGGQIVGCVLPGMQDEEPLVRQAAREVFARVTRTVGARLIESAVETQLTTSVRGVVEVVKVKPSVALAIVFRYWSTLRPVSSIAAMINHGSSSSSSSSHAGVVRSRDVSLLAAILDVPAAAEELRRYTEHVAVLLLACLCARRRGVRRVVRRFVELCPRDRESAPLECFLRALHSPRTRWAGLQALEAYGLSTDIHNVEGVTAVLRAVMGVLGDADEEEEETGGDEPPQREEVEVEEEEDTHEDEEEEEEEEAAAVSGLSCRGYAVRIMGALLPSLERRLIATLSEEEQSDVTLSKRATARYLLQYLDPLSTTLTTVAQASRAEASVGRADAPHAGAGRTWFVLGTGEPRLFDVFMTFYNRALDYGTAEQRVTAVHGIRDLLAWAPREVSAAAANTVAGRCSKVLFARNDGVVVQALVELCLQLLHYPASGKEKMVEGTMALAMFNAALCDSGVARGLTLRAVVELLQRSSRYADLMLGTVLTRRATAMESTLWRGVMLRFVATVLRYAAGQAEPSAAAPLPRGGWTSGSMHVTRLLEMTMAMWESAETPALACASGSALGALCRSVGASDACVADVKERTLAATSLRGTAALAGLSLVYSLLTSAAMRADATFLRVVAENVSQLAAEAKMTDKLSMLWTLRAAGAIARTRCVSAATFRPESYVGLMKRIGANDEQAQSTAQYFYDAMGASYPAAVPLFTPYYREPSAQWIVMGHFDADMDDEVVADTVY